jgi:hypothetical protein
LLALWLATSALFLGRAIAGHFERPLPSLGLIAVAMVIVGIAVGIRALLRGSLTNCMVGPRTSREWLAQVLPSLAVIFLAVGFTVAGAYVTGVVFLWIFVAAEGLFGAAGPWTLALLQRWFGTERTDRGTIVLDHPRGVIKQETLAKPVKHELQDEVLLEPVAYALENDTDQETETNDELPWLWQDTTALQELRYMTLPEGGLCVAGSQRVSLPATQQTTVVHTVFYPPFAAAPVITIELQEPETVAIKTAQVLTHGVRWELRMEQASDHAREVRWAFNATCTSDPDPRG